MASVDHFNRRLGLLDPKSTAASTLCAPMAPERHSSSSGSSSGSLAGASCLRDALSSAKVPARHIQSFMPLVPVRRPAFLNSLMGIPFAQVLPLTINQRSRPTQRHGIASRITRPSANRTGKEA